MMAMRIVTAEAFTLSGPTQMPREGEDRSKSGGLAAECCARYGCDRRGFGC